MQSFQNGDVVCFIGDSIMAANQHIPRIMDHYFQTMPDADITFYNCGISGGKTRTHCAYFSKLIAPLHPTHCFITLGINDSERERLAEPRSVARYQDLLHAWERYQKNLAKLCDLCEGIGAKVILGIPYPYAEYDAGEGAPFTGGYALMVGYADFVRTFAEKRGYETCDYHRALSAQMPKESLYCADRIHPNEQGQYQIAKCFLKAQGHTIGAYAPLPSYFDEYNEVHYALFRLYSAEDDLLQDPNLPAEQMIAFMKDFLANERYIQTPAPAYYQTLATLYLQNKPKEAELTERILRLSRTLKQQAQRS